MGLVRLDDGGWGPYPASTMPLNPEGVEVGTRRHIQDGRRARFVATCQNRTTLARFAGLNPTEAAAVLAGTSPDPLAMANPTLPPVERSQRAGAARPAGPPDVIDFICAANGTAQALSPEAVVQGDGVHVRVRNETGGPVIYRYDSPAGPGGGHEVPAGETNDVLYLVPPGPVRLHCGEGTSEKTAPSATAEVRDPAAFYRAVNVDDGLGCKITQHISDGWTTPHPTAEAALDALVADLGGKVTLSPGPGYEAAPGQTYLVYKDGRGYGVAETHLVDGRYRAEISQRCG